MLHHDLYVGFIHDHLREHSVPCTMSFILTLLNTIETASHLPHVKPKSRNTEFSII